MIKLLHFILRISLLWIACAVCYAIPSAQTPIEITADRAKYDHNQGVATYNGHVTMRQGDRTLHANRLQIYRNNENKIHLMIATGKPAQFDSTTDPQKIGFGSAEIIKYYPQSQKVDLLNDAKLTQNGDTVSGPKLTYNFLTEELKSDGAQRTTVILQSKRVQ